MSNNLVLNSWADEIGKLSARESVKLFTSYSKVKGEKVVDILLYKFVEHFIYEMIIRSLMAYKEKGLSNKEAYTFTKGYFGETKHNIQTAIASGFEKAFMEYTNQPVEYYCQIIPVGEPINKVEC